MAWQHNELLHHRPVGVDRGGDEQQRRVDGPDALPARELCAPERLLRVGNGEVRADYGMSGITAYGYTFQQVVADSGLMDYKARAYDPFLQKFIQPDTVVAEPGSSQGYNRYVYVNNNPVNLTDPSGNKACDEELGCSGKLQLPKQFTFPSRYDIFNNPIQIPNLLLTQPSLENGDDLVIVGYKRVVNWDKVDWLDVGISAAGIAGDVATATGLPGVIGWGVTEIVEFTEISSNIYDLSGVLTNDYFGSVSLGSQNIVTQMIKPENRKVTTRLGSLVPWVGTIFDIINIGWNIHLATESIPITKKSKFKLAHLINKS